MLVGGPLFENHCSKLLMSSEKEIAICLASFFFLFKDLEVKVGSKINCLSLSLGGPDVVASIKVSDIDKLLKLVPSFLIVK